MTIKRKSLFLIIVITVFTLFISLILFYRERKKSDVPFSDMYSTVRFEKSEDTETFKYSNNQVLLILTLDSLKKSSIKSEEVFAEEWKYRIVLGYDLYEQESSGKTTEILFKSNSMTIDGVEYIRNSQEEYNNILDTIASYYEKDDFHIYKKTKALY